MRCLSSIRGMHSGRFWAVTCLLLACLVTACGSGSGGNGDGPGAIQAGGPGQLAGIGSYDVAETDRGFDVTVYDLAGKRLGTAAIEPEAGVWVASYQAAGVPGDQGTLELWPQRHEASSTTRITGRLTAGNPAAAGAQRTLITELTWTSEALESGLGDGSMVLERIVLESAIPDGQAPPGIAGLAPTANGPVARIPAYERFGVPASSGQLSAWFKALDLDWMVTGKTPSVMLAMAQDGALASALLELLLPQSGTSGTQTSLSSVRSAMEFVDCTPESLQEVQTAYRAICTSFGGTANAACTGKMDGEQSYRGSLLDYFLQDECQWLHLTCLQVAADIGRCLRKLVADQDDAWCEARFPGRCAKGLRHLGNQKAQTCLCVCLPNSCAAHCDAVATWLGLIPTGEGQCAPDSETCGCTQDASRFCNRTFGDHNCGPGSYNDRLGAYVCNSANCGDGRFTPVCDLNPQHSEQCDESAPTGAAGCPDGFECRNCRCVPSNTIPEPGPDAVEPRDYGGVPDPGTTSDPGGSLYTLTGTIREGRFYQAGLDRNDMPAVVEARVAVLNIDSGHEISFTLTDYDGRYTFDVSHGPYGIKVTGDGFAPLVFFTTGSVGPGGQIRDAWLTPSNPQCQSDGRSFEVFMGLTGSIGSDMTELDVFGPDNLAERRVALDPSAALVCISGDRSSPSIRWHTDGLARVLNLPGSPAVTELTLAWGNDRYYKVIAQAGTGLPQPFVLGNLDGPWNAPATFPALESGIDYSLHFKFGNKSPQVLRFRLAP